MYKHLQNLHTHGTFADGKDEYEATVLRALQLGFRSVGFSEHIYMPYSPEHSMSLSDTKKYKSEIKRLKDKYAADIDVFCGIEFDMYSPEKIDEYDYVIGAVHYLKFGDKYIGFDRSVDAVKEVIDQHFAGDGIAFAKECYKQIALLPKYAKCDIIAHFDIMTKNCEKANLFDTDSKEYKDAALQALHAVGEGCNVFEVNTGAIARGYRTTPYPAPFLMKEIKDMGGFVIIGSDCHDNRYLDCSFDLAVDYIRSFGFKEIVNLTKDGFVPFKI